MRRRAKVDANQAAIVAALREVGASVQSLASLGAGVPDLLVCYHGVLTLMEIKDGAKSASRRRLTPVEAAWHAQWRGPVSIVTGIDEALTIVGVPHVES